MNIYFMIKMVGMVGITLLLTSSPLLHCVKEKIKRKNNTVYNLVTCSLCIGFIVGSVCTWNLFFGGTIAVLSYLIDLILTCIELNLYIKGGVETPRDNNITHNQE